MDQPFGSVLCISAKLTRFLFLEANDAASELPVHVESLLASDRVPAHHGVDVVNGIPADNTTALSRTRVCGLLEARVDRLEGPQEGNEVRGEALQSRHL